MLDTEIDEKNNLFVVTPKGTVSEADFEALGTSLNDYINRTDKAPGVVLNAAGVPQWENAQALFAHLKLVRIHHKVIEKVALVSDSKLLSIMPTLVDLFLDAKIRHFQSGDLERAREWATLVDPDETALKMIDGLPADVVGYEIVGTLTSKDYDEVLTPLIDSKLKEHDKLKIMVVLRDAFDGATPGAIWDDARLGFRHLTEFSKLALVSDLNWVRTSARIFGPLFPAHVHVFGLDEMDDAREWIIS